RPDHSLADDTTCHGVQQPHGAAMSVERWRPAGYFEVWLRRRGDRPGRELCPGLPRRGVLLSDHCIYAVGLVNLPWLADPSAAKVKQRAAVPGCLDLESRNRQRHGGLFQHGDLAPPSAGFPQLEGREG